MQIIDRKESQNAIESGASYLIEWPCGMQLWFDVWHDNGETAGDWNKYIFHTDNEDDMKEKAFQDAHNDEIGAYNFADALDIASEEYEKLIAGQKGYND